MESHSQRPSADTCTRVQELPPARRIARLGSLSHHDTVMRSSTSQLLTECSAPGARIAAKVVVVSSCAGARLRAAHPCGVLRHRKQEDILRLVGADAVVVQLLVDRGIGLGAQICCGAWLIIPARSWAFSYLRSRRIA